MRRDKEGMPKSVGREILSTLRKVLAKQEAQDAMLRSALPVLKSFAHDLALQAALEADRKDRSAKRRTVIERARKQGLLPTRKATGKRRASAN